MKRLVLVFLTAIMATCPTSLLIVLIGGLATAGVSSGSTPASTIPGAMMASVTATTMATSSQSTTLRMPLSAMATLTTTSAMVSKATASIDATVSYVSSGSVGAIPHHVGGGVVVNDAPTTADSTETFKVSVLGQSKGGSPLCTFSLVEFENNHPKDDIIVHSAHIEPSVMFPHGHAMLEERTAYSTPQHPPPHLLDDVHYPSDQVLHLRPGTITTVPVSIYPHRRKSFDTGSYRLQNHPPSLTSSANTVGVNAISMLDSHVSHNESSVNMGETSKTVHADLVDIIKHSRKHLFASEPSPLLSEDRLIYESLVANTSWGFIQMKVPYVCVPTSKELKYGLPSTLLFLDGGGGWYAPPTNFHLTTDTSDPFIYNIYMNNPSVKNQIKIWEVFTTRPELVRVEFHSYHSCHEETIGLLPRIPPGTNTFYVATVRLLAENFNSTMFSSHLDMGFLELRTSINSFSIGLNFIPNRGLRGIVHGISQSVTVSHIQLARDKAIDTLASKILAKSTAVDTSKPQMSIIKTYHASDKTPPISTQQIPQHLEQEQRIEKLNTNVHNDGIPSIDTNPSSIRFGIITSGSRMSRVPINIINHFGRPIRVIRVSVAMKTVLERGVNMTDILNETHRFDVGVDFAGRQITHTSTNKEEGKETYELSEDIVIPPNSLFKYPITVRCRFSPFRDQPVLPRSYTGSVIIWVTENMDITYREWERQLIVDRSLGRPYMTEIPFEAAILPGNFEISTDTLLYPTHFSMLSKEEQSKIKQPLNGKSPDYFDRDLNITNNFSVPVSILNIKISDAGKDGKFCQKHFSTPLFDKRRDGDWPTAETEKSLKGVSVRFTFQSDDNIGPLPKKCILSLETDRVGRQNLPLIIYSGEVVAEMEVHDGVLLKADCLKSKNGTRSSVLGMPCVYDWIENTIEGDTLRGAIYDFQYSRRKERTWPRACMTKRDPIEAYFRRLVPSSSETHSLHPIVLPIGAVNAGTVLTRSILLTNLNHVPVEVTASSTSHESMDINIGITPSLITETMPQPKREGMDNDTEFLENSPVGQQFLSKLKYKVDINLSPHAGGSELRPLFGRQNIVQTFENSTNFLDAAKHDVVEEKMECSSGFILSTDGGRTLTASTRKVQSKKWMIPPGGVARFTVTIRVPSKNVLKNDVTSFVTTGLSLQTNHGQSMPIVVTYSALVGQLQLKPSGDFVGTNFSYAEEKLNDKDVESTQRTIQVPMIIRDSAPYKPSNEHGNVPLLIESTFSQDIFLSEVRSCNRWFNVQLSPDNTRKQRPSSDSRRTEFHDLFDDSKIIVIEGRNDSRSSFDSPTVVPIGNVHSAMACSSVTNSKNFFACALEWLEKRDLIQPPGCGLSASHFSHHSVEENNLKAVKAQTISILKDVVEYLSRRYGGEKQGQAEKSESDNGGEPSRRKYIAHAFIEMFQKARAAWDDIESNGLNVITGHVSARTVYVAPETASVESDDIQNETYDTEVTDNMTKGKYRQSPLTIPVSSVLLKSMLKIPQLFQGRHEESVGVLDFETTHVSRTTSLYVPVMNPTGSSIRVRLSASTGADGKAVKDVFTQTSSLDSQPWWTGGSYWMSDNAGHLISASHNVTIKSGAGAFVSLVNPALHSMSAFAIGCGKRCGLPNNDADSVAEDKLYSTIGSASGEGSTLIGRQYDSNSIEQRIQSPQEVLGMIDPPPFSLGLISSIEVIIPPYGEADLGPVFFRPPTRGDFGSSIYVENSLTGFEEIKVRGRGGWEKIAFLDDDSKLDVGGDVEFRHGRSTLVFPGSASSLEGKPVTKAVVVANHGDFDLDISRIYMTSSEVKHFTNRRPPPFLRWHRGLFSIFLPQHDSLSSDIKCSARGFNLIACSDTSSNSWVEMLRSWYTGYTNHNPSIFEEGFVLHPNENITILVQHRPDCTFQTSYASLMFEMRNRSQLSPNKRSADSSHTLFQNQKFELLVGYDMNAYETSQCIPYSPPKTSMWEKTFTVPPFLQDIASFGLTRWTDVNGNPFIPRRPIEMSFLSASFLLVLFLLAFDLILELDSQPDQRKECSNWKSTSRCLARADPTSPDLVALGKEQTKHILLSRFKKDGVLPTQCVLNDGSFTRDRFGLHGVGTQQKATDGTNITTPTRRVPHEKQQVRTLSEAVFRHHNLVDASQIAKSGTGSESVGLLPCGLGWRAALTRGITSSHCPSNNAARCSSEFKFFARTQELRLKMKLEKHVEKTTRENAPVTPSILPISSSPESCEGHINGESSATKSSRVSTSKMSQESKNDRQPANGKHSSNGIKEHPPSNPPPIVSDHRSNNARSSAPMKVVENIPATDTKKQPEKVRVEKTKVSVSQSQQKQRIDAKQTEKDRFNREETKRDVPSFEESTSKIGKVKSTPKNLPSKSIAEHTTLSLRSNSGNLQERKESKNISAGASPSRKESSAIQHTKHPRQTKKASNTTKTAEQSKEKQSKQGRSKSKQDAPPGLTTTKKLSKLPESSTKSTANQSDPSRSSLELPDTEFPPLSSVPQSPRSETSTKTPAPYSTTTPLATPLTQKAAFRPPPGLLPPPGFANDGADTPLLLSPQNSSSQLNSPTMTMSLMSDSLAGMETSQSSLFHLQPELPALLSLINDDNLSDNMLFRAPSTDDPQSPPATALSDISMHIRPSSITPPLLESLSATDCNDEAPDDVQTLLGASSNFNVTNFLDGLLSDSMHQQSRNDQAQEAPMSTEALDLFNASAVPLDPWNPSFASESPRNNPLAAIIGRISDEQDTALRGEEDHHETLIAGIPLSSNTPTLLSPSALQNAGAYAEPAYASFVNEREEDDESLEPDSFYSQLLGED